MAIPVVSGASGAVALAALAGGVVLRVLGMPNQLVFTAVGFLLLSFVYLPARFLGRSDNALQEGWRRAGGLAATAALPLALGLGSVSVEGASVTVIAGAAASLAAYLAWTVAARLRGRLAPLGSRDWGLYGACVVCLALSIPSPAIVDDPGYQGPRLGATYALAAGPAVLVDEGHGNASTLSGSYGAFGRALAGDGYRVRPLSAPFTATRLSQARILVIVNALNREALGHRSASPMSAFSDGEIATVAAWVARGGSLLLVADHRPYAGAAADLAAAVGFTFLDGFADGPRGGDDVFARDTGAIPASSVTNGRNDSERVVQVQTFVGQAISVPDDAVPVILLGEGYRLWPSFESWRARRSSDGISAAGCAQLAVRLHGRGRVAVVGESGIFTAQLEHGLSWRRIGMNAPRARDNHRLLLNVVHWLDGLLP